MNLINKYLPEHNLNIFFLNILLVLGLASFIFFFFVINTGGVRTSLVVCDINLLVLILMRAYNPIRYKHIIYTIIITLSPYYTKLFHFRGYIQIPELYSLF